MNIGSNITSNPTITWYTIVSEMYSDKIGIEDMAIVRPTILNCDAILNPCRVNAQKST